jgi:hypothetical protein
VGKWPEGPKPVENTHFLLAKSCFKSGQKPTLFGQFFKNAQKSGKNKHQNCTKKFQKWPVAKSGQNFHYLCQSKPSPKLNWVSHFAALVSVLESP